MESRTIFRYRAHTKLFQNEADLNPIPRRSDYRIDRVRVENALYREELRDDFTKSEEAPAS